MFRHEIFTVVKHNIYIIVLTLSVRIEAVFRSREAGPLHELHVLVVVVVVVVKTLLKKSLRLRHFATELYETS